MFRPRVLLFTPLIVLAFLAFMAIGGAIVMALGTGCCPRSSACRW